MNTYGKATEGMVSLDFCKLLFYSELVTMHNTIQWDAPTLVRSYL